MPYRQMVAKDDVVCREAFSIPQCSGRQIENFRTELFDSLICNCPGSWTNKIN